MQAWPGLTAQRLSTATARTHLPMLPVAVSRRLEHERPSAGAGADPPRLCVFTTVALLAWLIGPTVVAAFALLGFIAYLRARRDGLRSSRCILRDTRLVLGYLA